MGFYVDSVPSFGCPRCGHRVGDTSASPLSHILCPGCSRQILVPGKLGSLRIHGLLGEGTGSFVYRAYDGVLGRDVAVKVLKDEDATRPVRQCGLDEARSLLLLDHPHVVKVYAIDSRRGRPCVLMELLPGGSLKAMIAGGRCVDEPLALSIGINVADALRYTNRAGLLHLDVKPENILFDAAGHAKLCDFGFADVGLVDRSHEVIGTPYYVSPELVRREEPDRRADIYSLGATLFHVLTGRPPFEGRSIRKLVLRRLKEPPPDPQQTNQALHNETARVVRRMLARDPEHRYRTYDELIRALTAAREALDEPRGELMRPTGRAPS